MEHSSDFLRLLRKRERRRLPGEAFAVARPGRRLGRGHRHTLINLLVAGALIGGVAPSSRSEGGAGTGGAVRFGYCHTGGGENCVVDGDTFWMNGVKIRIADIDTPETHPPRCDEERRLGFAAGYRLRELLSAGPVTLVPIDRDTDRYGRKLRVVERGGVSLGQVLVREGLARNWEGRRRGWCVT